MAWIISKISKDSTKIKIVYFFLIVFYLLFFYVICESSYMADDMINSNVLGIKYIGEENVWQLTTRIAKEWIAAGRFFPLSDYVYFLFYFIPSRRIYKLLIVVAVIINGVLFSHCINKITKSYACAFLTMLIYPLSMQLTGEFDSGIYCFHMLIQLTFLWVILSLIFCFKSYDYIGNNKIKSIIYGILSAVFLFCALSTYEVSYVLVPFIIICVYCYTDNVKETIKVFVPQIIAILIGVIINLILRMNVSSVGYTGISINFNAKRVIITFLKQIVCLFPFSRFIARTILYDGIPYALDDLISSVRITDLVMVIIYIILFISLSFYFKNSNTDKKKILQLYLASVCLIVFPAALISITINYQDTLYWGMGHISSYIQSFGLAISIVCLIFIIIKHLNNKKILTVVLSILAVAGSLILIGQEMEARTSAYINNLSHRYPVENIESAAKCGLYDDILENDYLYVMSEYYFDSVDSKTFYSKYVKKNMPVYSYDDYLEDINKWDEYYLNENNVYISNSYAEINNGYVYVSKISNIKDGNACTENIKVYINNINGVTIRYNEEGVTKVIDLSKEKAIYNNGTNFVYDISGHNIDVSSFEMIY